MSLTSVVLSDFVAKNPTLQWLFCKLRSFSESSNFCFLDRFLRNPLFNQETSFDAPHSLKESNHECIIRLLHPPRRSGLPHRSNLPYRTHFTHPNRIEEGRSFRQRRADYTDVTELAVQLAWGIHCFNKDHLLFQSLSTYTEVAYLPSTLTGHFEIQTSKIGRAKR